jgi:hypothetical protein
MGLPLWIRFADVLLIALLCSLNHAPFRSVTFLRADVTCLHHTKNGGDLDR